MPLQAHKEFAFTSPWSFERCATGVPLQAHGVLKMCYRCAFTSPWSFADVPLQAHGVLQMCLCKPKEFAFTSPWSFERCATDVPLQAHGVLQMCLYKPKEFCRCAFASPSQC